MRPTHSNSLVIGSTGTRNDQYQCHVDYKIVAVQVRRLCNLLLWLKNISIIRAFSGITEYTPDSEPYIGTVPGVTGLYVAAGFAGEAFCPGPLTGKILAEMIHGTEPGISLEPFRPDRFASTIREGKIQPDVSYPLDKLLIAWKAVEKYNPELND
jgi:glycine/D-amino acid oxidase-like deaminating enzyme